MMEVGPIRRSTAATVISGLLSMAGLVVGACGPGVQVVYEGNVRFEHCVHLDYRPEIVPAHRMACWSEWLASYTRGQTLDRVKYAQQRLERLKDGEVAPVPLSLELPQVSTAQPANPIPTSAQNPPPPVSPAPPASLIPLPPAAVSPPLPRPPGSADAAIVPIP